MTGKSIVLVVDDEPSARDTLEALLFREGYELAFASDGLQALEKAALLIPDLILLDVMMPGMDGFEVCQQLRADSNLAEVPIILVTALDDRDSRLQGIEAGADDFVSKPYDRIELRARVRNVTRLNRYRRLLLERHKFEWVVDQDDDGFVIVNHDGQVQYANPQARLFLGLPSAHGQVAHHDFLELVHKQYRCEPHEIWATWPDLPPEATQLPLYLVRPASTTSNEFWLGVDLAVMPMQAGERYLLRLRDVTSTIQARRSVWSFHAIVAHKLRTPLAGLVGYLDLFVEDLPALNDFQAELFGSVRKSTQRLWDEIQSVVEYIKATDLMQPSRGRCTLGEIQEIIGEVSTELSLAPPVILLENLEADLPPIPISRSAMEMIFWELFGNARKFHPQNQPKIDVRITEAPNGLCLQTGDDGLTLSPDQLAKIWLPHYQAEKGFTGQVPGMGLGLSMVASLVWSVDGTCRAYNREEGPGVVIELVLPLAKS